MPTPIEFANTLLDVPLIRALGTISARLDMRFALRGGVLRNLLFSYSGKSLPQSNFYEYVDPFSDIDLVVDDLSEWPQLSQALASSIPFAGFHHWEVTSTRAMKEASRSYTTIPADRLVLWFDGRNRAFRGPFLEGLGIDLEEVVGRPALHIDIHEFERGGEELSVLDRVLDVLRFARYSAAFPHLESKIDPAALLQRSELQKRISFLRPEQRRQTLIERRRLEMAVLDLIFTASDWNRASNLLELARNELPSTWLEESRFLTSVFYRSALEPGSGVGAIIYKSGPRSTPRVRMFNDSRRPRPGLENMTSLIPWVRLSYSGHRPDDCCNYRDFQSGVATIAWRKKGSGSGFSDLQETGFGAVAAVPPSPGEYHPGISQRELALLSVPAYLRRGTSVVLRADHGYVGGLLNRNVSFYLGIMPASTR